MTSQPALPRTPDAGVDVSAAGAARDAGVSSGPVLHKLERKLMGTLWAVTIAGGDKALALAAATRALDEVARLEAILSEWQPDSDISRVNQQAGVAPVAVDEALLVCVRASLEVARWSHGAFDISWAALRGLWDFSPDSAHVPPGEAAVKALLPLWNYRNIVLDEKRGTVFLKKKGMQIGLGGVAKGYALDRAGVLLRDAGFPDFLMYAGGQVLVHGKRGDRPWRVGIQHPREPRHFAFVEISDGSLATSGDYEHAFTVGGRTYHHILDPRTGFPSEKTSSVTLVARSALWADAVDTAVFIMGPREGLAALETAPGGPFEAAVVDPKMRLLLSDDMRARLVLTAEIEPDGHIGRPVAPSQQPLPKSAP
ncbi:MAG: thiamine biosynthesis lipoprotein ApbE [Myxococcaceae bacterium]|nr:thiamine biosynthesis lipoprotein ApbE [Myxococcaceae bacterium]